MGNIVDHLRYNKDPFSVKVVENIERKTLGYLKFPLL